MVVFNEVLDTFSKLGKTKLFELRSNRLKIMTVFGLDGLTTNLTNFPLWSPTPENMMLSLTVFWLKVDTQHF